MKPELSADLRALVRDVIRDAVAQRGSSAAASVESVRIATDAELADFVARLMDPAVQDRVKSGKLRFTLSAVPAATLSNAPLTGVITEKAIDRMAAGGSIAIAPGAVLTPLARDRARKLGLKLERRN